MRKEKQRGKRKGRKRKGALKRASRGKEQHTGPRRSARGDATRLHIPHEKRKESDKGKGFRTKRKERKKLSRDQTPQEKEHLLRNKEPKTTATKKAARTETLTLMTTT